MQFSLYINQVRACEWGLNAQQSILFSFIYTCPSWCRPIHTEAGTFYAISKQKICDELPILTDKPDTAWRMLKQLEAAGVVDLSSTREITLVRLTAKGRTWNSEKSASEVGKISEAGRKNFRGRSEKNPTNHITSNQSTKSSLVDACAPTGEQVDQVPYDQIVDLYNRVCGEHLPRCLALNSKRQQQIKKCFGMKINGKYPLRNLEVWEAYFNDCLMNDHWVARGKPAGSWRANIEFLTRPEVVLSTLEKAQ